MKQCCNVLIKNNGLSYIHIFTLFSRAALIPSIFSCFHQERDNFTQLPQSTAPFVWGLGAVTEQEMPTEWNHEAHRQNEVTRI